MTSPTQGSPSSHVALTRRQALRRLSAATLLGLGLWPGRLPADDTASGEFRFVVINDIHYMSDECGDWLRGVLGKIKAHDEVDFCLLAGDLTEHGTREHLDATRLLLDGLDRPVHVVIGNHDYETKTGDRSHYDAVFPDRLNYHFEHRGWRFIGLDTSDGLKYNETLVPTHTLRWLDDQLPRLNPKDPTVVFTHFPLGPGVTYRPLNADDVLERFRAFNLQTIFSGHFHGQSERMQGNAPVLTNVCCALKRGNHDGTKQKGYFLCSVKEGHLERRFVPVDLPEATR